MDKNRVPGADGQGERMKFGKALVIRVWWCETGRRVVKEWVLAQEGLARW